MQLHFTVDGKLIERLQERTDTSRAAEIARDALFFWDWATAEAQAGRKIVSTDPTGGPFHVPVMPAISPRGRW